MYTPTRITIPMSADEIEALRRVANRELRDPRDQARYILRRGLGLLTNDRSIEDGQHEQKELVTA